MAMRFCILITLCYFSIVFAQQCEVGQQAIFGMMLRRHTFRTMKVSIAIECNQACNNDFRCHSFNYVISKELCELNNRTKEARPENFVPDSERYYVKSMKKRVIPGTIPEFPAETCKEIKASEEGKATSGEYWFDSIIQGKTVLITCDMETEDADECKASIRVCGENADCQNTLGSYRCSCKTGYSGDGHTCTDIDECASGVHDCHVSASCTNIVGSFSCSCNLPHVGNGRSCSNPRSECQNYQSLTEEDRKITSGNQITICDNGLDGWHRFEGAAGTKMPTSCPPKNQCSTHASGWLNGTHPREADGQVTRTVCFHWGLHCCNWSRTVKVINCGGYFVYHITGTPACSLRYCSTD